MGNNYQDRQLLLNHKHNLEVSVWNDNASMYKLSSTSTCTMAVSHKAWYSKHHIHWGCIQASRSESTFPNPDFCGTGAFGAGLVTLDGPMPTFLYHVCLQASKISSNNGAACSRASK